METKNSNKKVSAKVESAKVETTAIPNNPEPVAVVAIDKAKAEKRAIALLEKAKATAQFAELTFVKRFLDELAKLDTKRAGFCLTNVAFVTNYEGFNFLCLPKNPRFSKLVEATEAGLKELQELLTKGEFKGSQLLVYTKSAKGHMVGNCKDFTNVSDVFAKYDAIKTIPIGSRIIKPSNVSLSQAVKLANSVKLETLTGLQK